LETFLTQIGPALPLTSDPPVICFWKWIGWKDYEVPKIVIWRVFLPKKLILFSPTCVPTYSPIPSRHQPAHTPGPPMQRDPRTIQEGPV
jgi:hypothetical protein